MEGAAQDFFTRLPDDLFLSILSRMEDLKFLFQCSLISKRFASTISSIKSVSLTLPSIAMHSHESVVDMTEFSMILDCHSAEIIGFLESTSIKELKFAAFLLKFTELRSIALEFMCPTVFCDPPFLKWKPKCRSRGDMVEGIVSLYAKSACRMTETELYVPQPGHLAPSLFSLSHSKCSFFYPLRCCKEWLLILCMLLKCHPTLESITITNSEKEAIIVLRDEELVKWRTNLLCRKLLNLSCPDILKLAWLPELYLPSSECLLTGVYFVLMIFTTDSPVSMEDDAMTWEYGEEEKLLGEAVKEMMTKHREKLKALCFNPYDGADG